MNVEGTNTGGPPRGQIGARNDGGRRGESVGRSGRGGGGVAAGRVGGRAQDEEETAEEEVEEEGSQIIIRPAERARVQLNWTGNNLIPTSAPRGQCATVGACSFVISR